MSQNNTISIYELNSELENMLMEIEENSQDMLTKSIENNDRSSIKFKITSPNNKKITLSIEVQPNDGFRKYTAFVYLEFSNLSIEVEERSELLIRPANEPYGDIIIETVTFNNVRFIDASSSDQKKSRNTLIINLCHSRSVEFIQNCNSKINLELTCGPKEDYIEYEPYLITNVFIKDCKMQNTMIKNINNTPDSDIKIINSTLADVNIQYKQIKGYGRCEINASDSKFNKLFIDMERNERSSSATNNITLSALISSNVIEKLQVSVPEIDGYECDARIVNKNQIEFLRCSGRYPNITAWGLHESIGRGIINERPDARKNIESNKEVLVKLKQQANDKGDRFQESTINYHVTSCDEQLISLEENKEFWQEKLIMQLGRLLSKHGTSWIRPLFGIVISNAVLGSIIFAIAYFLCPENIGVSHLFHTTGQLLNPLTTSLDVVMDIDSSLKESYYGSVYLLIYFLVAVSKGFYAMCVYEFVRAARRFTIK